MASRGILGVLESTSLTSLNTINGVSTSDLLPPLKRRKIFHTDKAETLSTTQTTFSVKGHVSSMSENEFKLVPIELLPRSALPFSWLDTSTAMQSSNIFASNDEVLEQMFMTSSGHGGGEMNNEPKVLATRLLSNGAIYVVERIKRGIFAMTKLQSNIEEGEIRVAAKVAAALGPKLLGLWNSDVDRTMSKALVNCWDWREAARVSDDVPRFDSFATKGKFDVSVVFEECSQPISQGDDHYEAGIDRQISIGDSFMALDDFTNPSTVQGYARTPPEETIPTSLLGFGPDAQDSTSPTPDSVIENLRMQYLEALYISKTSVAYFAKGPLTRCRNAFAQFSLDGEAPTLSTHYRESILSVKKMDTKYRETLPLILRNMTLLLSDDERPNKKKSRKNKKLGKNGLYSGEDEFLQKYWKARHLFKHKEGGQESKEEEIRRHISDLRLRETQLQILLILETIHLENPNTAISIEGNKGQHTFELSNTKRSKSKKEENLDLVLELLIDRLCIWHAVSAGEGIIPDSVKENTNSHLSGQKIESDALRDFCNEVIMPFYASRLPDQCKTIKKKLGGAAEVSPTRPVAPPRLKPSSSSSSASAASRLQPGAGDSKKIQVQQKPRRTLQRVLTDEQATGSQRTRHPSLLRSSTTPALQEVKRESVEPSLPSLGGSVRGGLQVARRADKREVDLNAVAKQHEAKLKKMSQLMEQKRELDAAINALRKPNRELVAKEVAEHAEKRSSTSSRKSKNPVRNPLGHGVQVTATPKGVRKKDMMITGSQSYQPLPRDFSARTSVMKDTKIMDEMSPEIRSDSISLVPGSTIRTNHILSSSVASKRKFNSITETPSRGVPRRSSPLDIMDDGDHDQGASMTTPNTIKSSIPCSRALFKIPNLPAMTNRSIDEQCHEPEHSSDGRDTKMKNMGSRLSPENAVFSIDQTPPAKGRSELLFAQQVSTTKPVAAAAVPSSPAPVIETPVKVTRGGDAPGPDQSIQSTPVKSIYAQLGWDDEADDDDELAF